MLSDITDLTNWTGIAPSVYTYQHNDTVSFIMVITSMNISNDYDYLDEIHPFGHADLYVSDVYASTDDKLHFLSDLAVVDKTITFCMEVAGAIRDEWIKEGM